MNRRRFCELVVAACAGWKAGLRLEIDSTIYVWSEGDELIPIDSDVRLALDEAAKSADQLAQSLERDLEYLESRKFSVEQIYRIYAITPDLLGLSPGEPVKVTARPAAVPEIGAGCRQAEFAG